MFLASIFVFQAQNDLKSVLLGQNDKMSEFNSSNLKSYLIFKALKW